jgi:hypothetical protein
MLKSRIKHAISNHPNNGAPGYFSARGRVFPAGAVCTVASIDNRELENADGFIELTGFGTIYNPNPNAACSDDLVMVFGDEANYQEEVVLFDKVLSIDTSFNINFKFHQHASAYEGIFTVIFSTGEVITRYVMIPDCSNNNFTTIRFKNTKQSSRDLEITIAAFNVVLHQ